MIKSAIASALLALAMQGCTFSSPSWYETQGLSFKDCGPTVAAMVQEWATNSPVTRHQVRLFKPRGDNWMGWWSLRTIHQYLVSKGVNAQLAEATIPPQGAMGVYHVDGNHFVVAQRLDDKRVKVSDPDPIMGRYEQSHTEFKARVTTHVYILIIKSE